LRHGSRLSPEARIITVRIVALEEHFTLPDLLNKVDPGAISRRGLPLPGSPQLAFRPNQQLADTGAARLADMDAAGITMQVLSLSAPGADVLDGRQAPALAREFNDRLAAIVRQHPDRYAGFAHLPMAAPTAAADELERTVRESGFKGAVVNGMTEGLFLDDASFAPLLSRAETLDVPIYIHPNYPPEAVRKAYYDNLPSGTGVTLSLAGWGWHAEVAIHVLRMVLAGTFDRHPKLKIIIGHMGEGLPAMMDRCDAVFNRQAMTHLNRTVSRTILDQVWVTTSGFFSMVPFVAAMMKFGPDRILFSVDYPFSKNAEGRKFLDALQVSESDREKIAHRNADALLKLGP
jgi:predicted TIM-barrel fold metal-dependent hydrolase